MMSGILVDLNGKLCVRYSYTIEDEPKERRLYWQVVSSKGNPYNANRPKIGDIATSSHSSSDWGTHDPATNQSTGSVSTGDGSTTAIYVEEVDIPCPKVRSNIETRYRAGRWEKYSKREGWIAA